MFVMVTHSRGRLTGAGSLHSVRCIGNCTKVYLIVKRLYRPQNVFFK